MGSPDYYQAYITATNTIVEEIKQRVATEPKRRAYVSAESYTYYKVINAIRGIIASALQLQPGQLQALELEEPPAHIDADFALPAFPLAKALRSNPAQIAGRIAEALTTGGSGVVTAAVAAGPYINISLERQFLFSDTLSVIAALGNAYGESDLNKGKTVLVEYSSPNIAKPIGVGHLRSTIIGQSLVNLYRQTGYSVISDNHLGDWGTQFGELIYAFTAWGNEEMLRQDPIRALKDLYVRYHAEAEGNPEMEQAARALFTRLENKDPELVRRWVEFKDLSIADYKKTYDRLGVSFDAYIGESYFNQGTGSVVEACLASGVAAKQEQDGPIVVENLEKHPAFLLQKADGSSLYITRDLVSIKFRVDTFAPETLLYVVGSEQELHFKQLFSLARAIGYLPEGVHARHIGFGMVMRDGKKMSTRRGTLIELQELLAQAVEKSKDIIRSKNPAIGDDEINGIAEIVGVGAIIYNDLRQSRLSNISFDWERMLDFEAGSAAYLQYTHTRVLSILRNLGAQFPGEPEAALHSTAAPQFKEDSEYRLARKLMLFPASVARAQASDSPHVIAAYLEELCQLFNTFYREVSVMRTTEQELRLSRILLVHAVALVIRKGLALLNIGVPHRM